MHQLQLKPDIMENTIQWLDIIFPMMLHGYWNKSQIKAFCSRKTFKSKKQEKDQELRIEMRSQQNGKINATEQLNKVNYKKANLPEVINKIECLSQNQRKKLLQLLLKHKSIFEGKRGEWRVEEVHIKLKENAKPFYG